MSGRSPSAPATVRDGRDDLGRERAARLLRDARRLGPEGRQNLAGADADEAVEWAYSTMPDSLGARRLKIQMLLRQGNLEAADTLIAQGLLQRPTNASLSYLRARSLFAQGKLAPARRELRLVLAKRPRHRGTLELAGRVAFGLGDRRCTVALLERAERRRPDDGIRSLLTEVWLESGRPDMARAVLRRMAAPTALLQARVLRAEGRLLEARETLEKAARNAATSDRADITTGLISLLEETSDLQRLRRTLEPVGIDQPAVLARAGLSWLGMGAFHTAAVPPPWSTARAWRTGPWRGCAERLSRSSPGPWPKPGAGPCWAGCCWISAVPGRPARTRTPVASSSCCEMLRVSSPGRSPPKGRCGSGSVAASSSTWRCAGRSHPSSTTVPPTRRFPTRPPSPAWRRK
ncbi:MAG: tetratricopeptide repeat protein [Planctomycetota bacterium]|jgi:tetratricopeptide (TPR) repeat protein